MSMKTTVLLRSSMLAYDELARAFGRRKALRILLEVGRRNAVGLPFKRISRGRDEADRETRAELAPAVNIFDVLKERVSEERAYEITRRIVLNSSLFHLRAIYPDFKRGNFLDLVQGDPGLASTRLATDFAFADTKVVEITKDKASFDVVDCRIPRTLALVGAQRLAPIFCEVDLLYFPIYEPGVELSRSGTIVRGSRACDFRLTWRPK